MLNGAKMGQTVRQTMPFSATMHLCKQAGTGVTASKTQASSAKQLQTEDTQR
jgi:hypothetical protein